MPANEPIVDPGAVDCERVLAGRDAIREWVPQRHEFEMLDGILHYDARELVAVAFKEIAPTDFWVRGHIPGRPLFPGVLMIESAAQLCCYLFCRRTQEKQRFFAFGGVSDVRFRGVVKPGDTILLLARAQKVRSNLGVFDTQAFHGRELVYEGVITGMVLPGS
jgi:3-hydroxyacyl-[acyl-carrier-protein] dehydratase